MNILTSAFGNYEVMGAPNEADCVIGHAFGTLTGADSVNRLLADTMLGYAEGRPVIAERLLADAFPDTKLVARILEDPISNTLGTRGGTWGALVSVKEYMAQEGLKKPLLIGQAHHIGRITMQAKHLGIEPIVPPHLPRRFDAGSEQYWTQSLAYWVPRELVGSLALRLQDKL